MRNYTRYSFCLISLLLVMNGSLESQNLKQEEDRVTLNRILFVFDASQSMYGTWQSDIKMNIARNILSEVLDSISGMQDVQVALRVYGHQYGYPPQVCTDTRLEVPFGENNIGLIKYRLSEIQPRGTTPLAYALEQASGDFPVCENCRNIIVLITDGIEECGGDPCVVAQAMKEKGVVMQPFIIGIGRNFKEAFDCVGTYFDASSEESFQKALDMVIAQALHTTTAQVNLLDDKARPVVSDVAMTFYDHYSGKVHNNFMHTMNNRGVPDTLVIDPVPVYDVVVHTVPEVRYDSVKLISGQHNEVNIAAPVGELVVNAGSGGRTFRNLQFIVRRHDSMATVNVQNVGEVRRYLAGRYDVELLTLPRLYFNDIAVVAHEKRSIPIPTPGIVVIRKSVTGYGSLYVKRGERLEWIYDLRDNVNQETLVLQPGNYLVIFRSRYARRTFYTIEKPFTIQPGETVNVKLFAN